MYLFKDSLRANWWMFGCTTQASEQRGSLARRRPAAPSRRVGRRNDSRRADQLSVGGGGGERGPDGVAVDAEGLGEVGDGDDDATPEADALQVAAADELVCGGTPDAEDLSGLLDGEGEGVIGSHTPVGRERGRKPRTSPYRPTGPVRGVLHRV